MSEIQVLSVETVNKIAAGEVVERPASAVKEMVENAIDAGATKVTVEIKNGGITFIRVTDNGKGIMSEDAETAFLPHATSKIRSAEDLQNILTMGFRGEALSSIAAVSKVELLTKTKESPFGTSLVIEGGNVISKGEAGCPDGTTIVVSDLFFNTPARMHFLKKDSAEGAQVSDVMQKMALSYPEVSFKVINNGRETMLTPGTGKLSDVLPVIFGKEIAQKMVEVDFEKDGVKISGFAGLPEIARNNRSLQNFFVNGRWVKSKEMQFSAEAAYKTMLMTGKHPILVIKVELSPMLTDVNVHPQKMEIKFANEKIVTSAVFWGIQNALLSGPKAREAEERKHEIKSLYTPKIEHEEKSFKAVSPKETVVKAYEQQEKSFDFFAEESKELFTPPKVEKESSETFFDGMEEESFVSYTPQKEEFPEAEVLPDYKVKGQIFDTYIIIEQGNEMLLLDQHAAHERLRYEEMVEEKCIYGQMLLMPEMIRLSEVEGEMLSENSEAFEKLGFVIDPFGNGQYAVRQMPDEIINDDAESTVISILELIRQNRNPDDILDKAFFMIACKGAVKANRPMSLKEMEILTKQVMENDRIKTCPHGRPLLISITKKWIEKEFKRIV